MASRSNRWRRGGVLVAVLAMTVACNGNGNGNGDGEGTTGGPTGTTRVPTSAASTAGSGSGTTASSAESGDDTTVGGCMPATCETLGRECGETSDGCGVALSCGACADGARCSEDGLCIAAGEPASSLSQYGITWTFDGEHATGQFVTGDWWVIGPLVVESVTPAPGGGRNGSMLDPVGPQAYDARGGEYDADVGVAFPLPLEPGHSLVSAISHPDTPECEQGGADGWFTYDGDCQRGPIATQAILTVLAEPPPVSAFRPPYAGTEKPLHASSGLCWDAVPSLAAPANLPDGANMLRHVARPWIDHLDSWTMQHGCATLNMYCYGREIGNVVSTLAAFVLVESPDRETVALRLVQLGIDNYGVLQAGGGWGVDGGHFNGRKFPIVFAGGMLGDAAMASPGQGIGNEDSMTYYGANGEALWGRDCDNCYFEAGCQYTESCPNGSRDCKDPAELVDGCDDYRNCCTSPTWVGETLAIRLMGLRDAWDHPALFDYVDRWMSRDVPGGGAASNDFVAQMWAEHAADAPAAGCP